LTKINAVCVGPAHEKHKESYKPRPQAIAGIRDAAATHDDLPRIRDLVTRQTRFRAFMER